MNLLEILQIVLSPVTSGLYMAAIIAGLFFGAIYNSRLNLPKSLIYHKLIAGLGLIGFLFIFDTTEHFFNSQPIDHSQLIWATMAIMWALFCGCIWIGQRLKFTR